MVMQHSFAHITCIINGHTFSGWAEAPPYDWEQDESSERTRGADGGLYALGMPIYGGMFTFRMQPNSPTAQWAVQQEQMRSDAHFNGTSLRPYAGTLADTSANINYRLEGGVIVTFPKMIIPGEDYEGSIDFEVAVSNVDGGSFRAPRSTP